MRKLLKIQGLVRSPAESTSCYNEPASREERLIRIPAGWIVCSLLAASLTAPPANSESASLAEYAGIEDAFSSARWPDISDAELRADELRELRRARAHARLGNTLTANTSLGGVFCPQFSVSRTPSKDQFQHLVARHAPPRPRWQGVAPSGESVSELFSDYVSGQVVQSRCIYCHVDGGVSGHTRLVLVPSTVSDHEKRNLETFRAFLDEVEDGADRILNKIQGVGHGGGVQVPNGSVDFANMERFLRLLDGGTVSVGISPEALFDGVTMAKPEKTLRRAALIFAGRLPTRSEIGAVSDGRISSLRRTIRNLMRGPKFHEFLIRASNDRLLTDRHLDSEIFRLNSNEFFVDLANTQLQLAKAAIDRGYEFARRDPSYAQWERALRYGLARAPLELIAHVVEKDLPYTEILTADYIMANPVVARAYGADTQFQDPYDPEEFRPSRIVSYYRNDDSKVVIEVDNDLLRGRSIVNPGNLSTDYPHAGILNTTVFLSRYPTTATNRNRARSRWTYYHFLAVDIEKSASRTTDPVALADTNNPTMNNPACTVCHSVMDPVAGAFQNYGEEGLYRDAFGGRDSLASLYKRPRDGSETPYQRGDTWYRDMREPGFNGDVAPNADNSLQWLARRIVADERFAESAVRFWWPGILGQEVILPPEDERDSDFEARLLASASQAGEVKRLAAAFQTGIAGRRPFNAKDLLAEIAISPWFRAESLAVDDPVRERALRYAGMERLLTPEELERKTEAITGFVWGRRARRWAGGGRSHLTAARARESAYELVYGGIDSDGVPSRAGDITPLMAAVAQSHAVEVSCPVVAREFYLWPEHRRRLFAKYDLQATPETERGTAAIKRKLAELHGKLYGVSTGVGSPDVEEAFQLFVEVWARKRDREGGGFRDQLECAPWEDHLYLQGIADDGVTYDNWGRSRFNFERFNQEFRDPRDPNYVARAWVVTLAFLLTDYRYLYH